jgi:hypothetical protein
MEILQNALDTLTLFIRANSLSLGLNRFLLEPLDLSFQRSHVVRSCRLLCLQHLLHLVSVVSDLEEEDEEGGGGGGGGFIRIQCILSRSSRTWKTV